MPFYALAVPLESTTEDKVEVVLDWKPPPKYKVDWHKVFIPAKTGKPPVHLPKKNKAEAVLLLKERPAAVKGPAKAPAPSASVGYYLYYADNPQGPFHRINDTPVKTSEAKVLAPSASASLYFAVSAVLPGGKEGPRSAVKEYKPGVLGITLAGTLTLNLHPPALEADGKSRAKITAALKDASGRPLAGRELEFSLGSAGDLKKDDDVGVLQISKTQTDKKGELEAVFMTGNEPKSALFQVKDPQSKLKATAALRQWVELESALTLEEEGEGRGGVTPPLHKGGLLEIKVIPASLPADGVSTARIEILAGEGIKGKAKEDKPKISLWEGGGTLKTLDEYGGGRLTALYTAPTKAGRAVLSVKYGAVIKLVTIKLKPQRAGDSSIIVKPENLPADARSQADILVVVKDEAGKALTGAEVKLSVSKGGGRIIGKNEGVTDAFGQARFQYRAGHRPGEVALKARVLSKAPEQDDWQEGRFTKVEGGASSASKTKPAAVKPDRKSFPFQSPTMERSLDRKQDFIFK